jgi:calcium-dependent protein kinase
MKLIDFGCAKVVKDDEVVRDYAGSPYYVAPEVLNERWSDSRTGRVWKACDMWSVGVIIFLFVCGYPPFPGSSTNEIFKRIRRGRYYYPNPSVLTLSDSVHDLIKRCLGNAITHPTLLLLTIDGLIRCEMK